MNQKQERKKNTLESIQLPDGKWLLNNMGNYSEQMMPQIQRKLKLNPIYMILITGIH